MSGNWHARRVALARRADAFTRENEDQVHFVRDERAREGETCNDEPREDETKAEEEMDGWRGQDAQREGGKEGRAEARRDCLSGDTERCNEGLLVLGGEGREDREEALHGARAVGRREVDDRARDEGGSDRGDALVDEVGVLLDEGGRQLVVERVLAQERCEHVLALGERQVRVGLAELREDVL